MILEQLRFAEPEWLFFVFFDPSFDLGKQKQPI